MPVIVKVPLLVIPDLNSNGALPLTEKVPDVTVTNPRNCFKPPVAVMGEAPVELVVPRTVKVPVWLMVVPVKTRF